MIFGEAAFVTFQFGAITVQASSSGSRFAIGTLLKSTNVQFAAPKR
jgi:hypothetical protein